MVIRNLLPFLSLVLANSLRIPENPCPDIFTYYKKSENGETYGEANIPYDGKNNLEFSVNASLVGYFQKADLKIQLVTPLKQIINGPMIKYNIFFPFSNVVPKITQLMYNGKIYCSGPPEPLIPGTPGITNVWSSHIYSFSTLVSREQEHSDNAITATEESGTSDADVPVKDPNFHYNSSNSKKPNYDENPFLNTDVDTGFVTGPKSKKDEHEECGIANNLVLPLILGGTESQEGQYPWLAALFSYNSKNNIYEYRCTASIISSRHVITAARCVQFYKVQIVKTEDILFVLGKNDLKHWATNGAITRGAVNVQTHPYFQQNSYSAHGDVAIITLDKPLIFSKNIRSVCLWEDSEDLDPLVNKKGTLAAWGADETNENAGHLSILKAKHVEITIVSQFECLKSDIAYQNLTSEKTFCAGDKDEKGPCIGDSGAGFVVPKNRIYYLRGIASFVISNNGTCDLKKYAIFCDVAKFGSWVKSCMTN